MDLVEATGDDVETLAEYWYALATEMEPHSELNEVAHDGLGDAEPGFENLLDAEDTTVYLLVAGDTEVGYLLLREGEHPSRTHGRYARLVDLYIAEGHRDEGHGSEAIGRAEAIARERGVNYLKVDCEWHNDGARRFYEDNGFTEKQVTYVRELD